MANQLLLQGVGLSHRRRPVLSNVTLTLPIGLTVLLGENGSGKSSLIRFIAGLMRPEGGTVRWENGNTFDPTTEVGYLPQSPVPTRLLTVRAYVEYFAMLRGLRRRDVTARAEDALALVGLADRRNDRTAALSGGMFRRLAIAATVVGDPHVLLFDEPTAGLDLVQRESVLQLIQSLAGERIVLFSTHLIEDLAV